MKFSSPDWPWTTTMPGTGPPDSGKLVYRGMLLPSTFKVSHELVIFHLLRTQRLCCPFPKLSTITAARSSTKDRRLMYDSVCKFGGEGGGGEKMDLTVGRGEP